MSEKIEMISALVKLVLKNNISYKIAVINEIVEFGQLIAQKIDDIVSKYPVLEPDLKPLAEILRSAVKMKIKSQGDDKGNVCAEFYKWDDEFRVCAQTYELLIIETIIAVIERLAWEMKQQLNSIIS